MSKQKRHHKKHKISKTALNSIISSAKKSMGAAIKKALRK